MTINALTVWLVFGAAFVVAVIWGIRWAFVAVYLPSLMLLNQVGGVLIQHAPVSTISGPLYAMLLALPFQRESLRFRPCSIDVVAVLLLVSLAVTGMQDHFETAVSGVRGEALRIIIPYFVARIVFQDWRARRATLWVLVGVTGIITVAALIEFRLTPYFYQVMLTRMGMANTVHGQTYVRYGFFRVSGPAEHPISFGNAYLIVLGMIAVLAKTSGVSLKNPWVAVALAASVLCVVVSLSYTPWLGLIAGSMVLAVLQFVPFARKLVLPLTLAAVFALTAYTYKMAHEDLDESERGTAGVEGSLFIRHLIVKECWDLSVTAGPFGWGLMTDFTGVDDFDLQSVDNSYLGLAMTRGWVYMTLWVALGVLFAARVAKAFRLSTDPSQVFPLAVCTATVLGVMVAMYTVWAGAFYAMPWFLLLGLSNALIDQVFAAADGRRTVAPAVGRLRPPVIRGGLVGGRPAGAIAARW